MKHSRTAAAAFSLVEVILALTIFVLTSLALIGLFLSSRANAQVGMNHVEAGTLAQAEVQKFKLQPYGTLVGYIATPPAPYSLTYQDVPYNLTLTVSRLDNIPGTAEYDMLDLKLLITWQQKKALQLDDNHTQVQQSQTTMDMHAVVGPEGRY